MPLNILFLWHWLKPDGSGIYCIRLAKKLTDRGHKVVVCSSGGALEKDLENINLKHYKLKVLDLDPLMPSLTRALIFNARFSFKDFYQAFHPLLIRRHMNVLFSFFKILRIVRKEGIHVIHAHSYKANALGYLCSRITKKPLVIFMGFPSAYDMLPSEIASIMPNVGKVLVNSQEIMNYLVNGGGELDEKWKTKILVLPYFVELGRFHPPSNTEVRRYEQEFGIPRNSKKIVYISRLDPDKEIPVICTINAAPPIVKEVPNAQIIIAGGTIFRETLDRISGKIREMNDRLGQMKIVMTGWVKEVEKVMMIADVVIAVGQTAVEAMACGKPVIIAGHRTGPFGGSFGGIVSKENIRELQIFNFTGRNSSKKTTSENIADACIKLLKDSKMAKDSADLGRRIAVQEYDSEKRVDELERIYLDLVRTARTS